MTLPAVQQQHEPTTALEVFNSPKILAKFHDLTGNERSAKTYIQSALIVIADSPQLMECTPRSLVKACLRSASLQLSLDPVARQAYLIPRSAKVKAKNGVPEHYEKQATFQPHYHGLYDLAVRTNKYRVIAVNPIYEGESVFENVQTGIHTYSRSGSGVMLAAEQTGVNTLNDGYRNVTKGRPQSDIIGYLGYFKTNKGFEKSVWMTVGEIHEHAQKWAPDNYNSQYGAWKDAKKRPTMEMKTVFIQLSKFMDLSGDEKLSEAISAETDNPAEDEAIEAIATEAEPAAQDENKAPADILGQMGY